MEVMEIPKDARLVSVDGKKIPVTGSVSPVKDISGKFAGTILTLAPASRPKVLRFTGRMKF